MTSKEKLNEIKEFAEDMKNQMFEEGYNRFIQFIEDIKKDLEILEILKNHLKIEFYSVGFYANMDSLQRIYKYLYEIESKDTGATIHINLDAKEYSKIKEYLEK